MRLELSDFAREAAPIYSYTHKVPLGDTRCVVGLFQSCGCELLDVKGKEDVVLIIVANGIHDVTQDSMLHGWLTYLHLHRNIRYKRIKPEDCPYMFKYPF